MYVFRSHYLHIVNHSWSCIKLLQLKSHKYNYDNWVQIFQSMIAHFWDEYGLASGLECWFTTAVHLLLPGCVFTVSWFSDEKDHATGHETVQRWRSAFVIKRGFVGLFVCVCLNSTSVDEQQIHFRMEWKSPVRIWNIWLGCEWQSTIFSFLGPSLVPFDSASFFFFF